jgi:hypothetical protein
LLHELTNIDKHRTIHPVVFAGAVSYYFGAYTRDYTGDITNWGSAKMFGGGPLEPGTHLMKVRFTSLEMARHVKMDYEFVVGVSLERPPRPGANDFLPEPLYTILRFIEDEAIPVLTPFLP